MPRRLPITGCLLLMLVQGCVSVGPTGLSNARATYNAVVNETDDQQVLMMIVRQRYDETFGMLAVSSITANLRVSGTFGANAGIGPRSGYAGNLVPLNVEATYEDNPTISYVPLRGEQFVERMLAPVSAEQALLLSRMSTDKIEVLRFLLRRANGLANPLYSSQPVTGDFSEFIELFAKLREAGKLDIVRPDGGELQVLLHDYTEADSKNIDRLLRVLGIAPAREGTKPLSLPLRFFVGASRKDGIDVETPSAMEVIEAAAMGVDVPQAHLTAGLARLAVLSPGEALIAIHSSRERPRAASVAVSHRGWWFFVDERDARSKQGFMVLRTLIGLRLDEAKGQKEPVLTVPVGR